MSVAKNKRDSFWKTILQLFVNDFSNLQQQIFLHQFLYVQLPSHWTIKWAPQDKDRYCSWLAPNWAFFNFVPLWCCLSQWNIIGICRNYSNSAGQLIYCDPMRRRIDWGNKWCGWWGRLLWLRNHSWEGNWFSRSQIVEELLYSSYGPNCLPPSAISGAY